MMNTEALSDLWQRLYCSGLCEACATGASRRLAARTANASTNTALPIRNHVRKRGGAAGSWLLTSCIRESVHILSPVSRHCHCLVWRNPNDQHYPTVREITDKDQYYTRMLTRIYRDKQDYSRIPPLSWPILLIRVSSLSHAWGLCPVLLGGGT